MPSKVAAGALILICRLSQVTLVNIEEYTAVLPIQLYRIYEQ
jgi:hypothetical protein